VYASLVIDALQWWPRQVEAAAFGNFGFGGALRVPSLNIKGET
jgi:hypothetical protein